MSATIKKRVNDKKVKLFERMTYQKAQASTLTRTFGALLLEWLT